LSAQDSRFGLLLRSDWTIWKEEAGMDFLQDPNVVYVLLAGGLIAAVLSLAAPGTGFLEIGALFILGVAGWSIITYDLPINWWALVLLAVGAVLFFLSVRRRQALPLLAASVLAIVLGSAFLFSSGEWYAPAVSPLLALTVSVLSGGFFWIVGRKAIEASAARPTHDLEGLIGLTGEAKSRIHREGAVLVNSELWSARSDQPIPEGALVRVVGREGFMLQVEPLVPPETPE
jgi:membrane-bound serine protease (ClpP class)